jgi:tetratricopeptide (TPR) repeat protein
MANTKTYLIGIILTLTFVGLSQGALEKVKSQFNAKNYKSTISEINLLPVTVLNYDSLLYLKAYSQIKLNLNKEAAATILELQQKNNSYYEVYLLKGMLCAKKEKYSEAILNFNKVVAINPNHDKALYNMALAKGLLEDYKNAIKDLDKCITINPNYTMAFYNRAYWHETLEDYNLAILDYKKVISLDQHYAEAYTALAYVYSQNGDTVNACETLNAAKAEGIEPANDLMQTFCK